MTVSSVRGQRTSAPRERRSLLRFGEVEDHARVQAVRKELLPRHEGSARVAMGMVGRDLELEALGRREPVRRDLLLRRRRDGRRAIGRGAVLRGRHVGHGSRRVGRRRRTRIRRLALRAFALTSNAVVASMPGSSSQGGIRTPARTALIASSAAEQPGCPTGRLRPKRRRRGRRHRRKRTLRPRTARHTSPSTSFDRIAWRAPRKLRTSTPANPSRARVKRRGSSGGSGAVARVSAERGPLLAFGGGFVAAACTLTDVARRLHDPRASRVVVERPRRLRLATGISRAGRGRRGLGSDAGRGL